MAEIKTMTKTELHELIDMDLFGKIIIATTDIEKHESKGSRCYDKNDTKKLVDTCKTIIALIDDAGEDSLDIYALYTAIQEDILNIKPVGLEHKMIMFPHDGKFLK